MWNKPAAASNVEWRTGANKADGKCTPRHRPLKYKRATRLLVRNGALTEGSGKNVIVFAPRVGIGKTQDP
jgi:hypothetical protein